MSRIKNARAIVSRTVAGIVILTILVVEMLISIFAEDGAVYDKKNESF